MKSAIPPALILKDVDDHVKDFRQSISNRDFKKAATDLLTGARDIAFRLLEEEGFAFSGGDFQTPFDQLNHMAKLCSSLEMKDGSEVPTMVVVAKDIFIDLAAIQGTLDGRNSEATDEPTHMAIIITRLFTLSQNYTLAQLWENTFWEQFGQAKKAQYEAAAARKRGGGHNAKWAKIAEPYKAKHPAYSRTRLAGVIAGDFPDADLSTISRGIRGLFSKEA